MILKKVSRFLLMLLFLPGCIDTIEIDLPSTSSGRLVIEGFVEQSPDIYRFLVTVSRSNAINSDAADLRENASIGLVYNGQIIRSLINGQEDTISIDLFHQLYGGDPRTAKFNIWVQTSDGGLFEAIEQPVLRTPQGSTVQLKFEVRPELNDIENLVERGYVKVLVNSPLNNDFGDRVSFRWDVSGVYYFPEVAWTDNPFFYTKNCYVKDFIPFNEVNVLNGSKISGPEVREFEICETPADFRFASGYYFTVIQKSMDASAAEYWDQIRQSIEREGTIFDPPVGAIRTNIKQIGGSEQDVLGYFYTAGIDTLRHLATREESGKQRHLCAFETVSEACCDCLLIVNSSLEKPFYWER
ncbi:MAG: DUF4249 family protein [Saprospiraceae bacterium]|nr:DUF4249 family protein [Saprospiraceae bacterium]